MASTCKSAIGCVDEAHIPARSTTYINLHKWAESDAEFVKSVIARNKNVTTESKFVPPSPRIVDSYSCRQMYVRSYTFSKKETVPEKTRKCFGRVKERAAEFPFTVHHHQRRGTDQSCGGSSIASFDSLDVVGSDDRINKSSRRESGEKKMKRPKKGCERVRKMKEVTCTAISAIFRGLLSCAASVDVVDDRRCSMPAAS